MDIDNVARVHWSCRRGMRELDLLIMPFFEKCYNKLPEKEKCAFVRLLSYDDPALFSWLMRQSQPEDIELINIVNKIRLQNEQNGFVAG